MANPDSLHQCVHCGLCLSACPTYVELGTEMDSPRGRIYLVRAIEEGTLSLSDDVVRHLDLCLGCRGCETACPSGVRYGSIIGDARAYVEAQFRRSLWDRGRRRAIMAVFPHKGRLRTLLAAVRVFQRMGLWTLVQRVVGPASLIPVTRSLPPLPEVNAARGRERARVGLLVGCVAGELFGKTNEATVRALVHNGVTVLVPGAQGCCGALHLHGGDPETARVLARRNVEAFAADLDAVVVNAAGCGVVMKEYGDLLAGDARYASRAREFGSRVRDVTEFLASLPARAPARPLAGRVTYHDACHLAHGQGVREAPRELLGSIPGLEVIPLPESDLCCGSAGSYNLIEPAMARRLGDRKIDNIVRTGANCVVTANPGCALQIRSRLRARGLRIRVVHPVELLSEAYGD